MADNEERIKIKFETNADQVKSSTDGLNSSIERTIDDNEKLNKSNKKVSKGQGEVSKSSGDQKAGLESLGGGFGAAINGAKGLLKSFTMLLANPIILVLSAIVLAVTALFKAFTSTKAGGEALDRVMSGLGAVMDVLRDNVLRAFSALKNLLTLNFSGLKNDLTDIANSGAEMVDEFNKAADAAKRLQEVADVTRDLGVERSKLNVQLAESKRLIEDENTSYEDKKKAIDEVRDAEQKLADQQTKNALKKLKAIQDQNELSDSGSEALQAAADAEIEYNNLLLKSKQDKIALLRIEKRAENEEATRKKGLADQEKALYKERQKIREQEQKEIEAFNKAIADKEKDLLKQLQDLQDDSAQQKLDRQKERDLAEIELLRQKGADVAEMLEINEEIYREKQADINEKQLEEDEKKKEEELKAQKAFLDGLKLQQKEYKDALNEAELEDIYNHALAVIEAKREAALLEAEELGGTEEEIRQRKLEADAYFNEKTLEEEKKISEARQALKKSEQDSLSALGNAGLQGAKDLFGKNKAIQKGIIIAEGGVALARVASETVGQVSKDNLASPLTFGMPWAGVHIATGVLGAASIISNTSKALKAVGGGGSIGAAPKFSAPRGGGGVSARPQTGFQASSENQIATSIQNTQQEQPALKAYVVTSDVTKGQDLDNKIIQENSFG